MPGTLAVLVLSILLPSLHVSAADDETPFDCRVTTDGKTWDLTKLAGEHTASRTRSSPPSSLVDTLRFDLCDNLKKMEGVKDDDQCIAGTRACLTTLNKKPEEKDLVVAVVPLAQTALLKPSFQKLDSGLSLVFHGPEYPHPFTSELTAQSITISLNCDGDKTSDPEITSYDGSSLNLKWTVPEACPLQDDGGSKDGEKPGNGKTGEEEKVGSGIGWFFLVLLLASMAYFGVGAYYNYTTYGARGADLIPHRDFWKEVPYMLSDVVSHLCSTVRPRHSSHRGGYIAV
ncbi:hypothetical protein BDN72DRAFT_832284 [Pluteus cervinus]|uniref:Uncharacterized protein n=1 Tax=Pluteus cervinus TaxID=181527 RepID=A0ACD3BCU2_9AGAR|nr:hypothetical protein BDN72DRAFT_832284 [Pluteus cervinus]